MSGDVHQTLEQMAQSIGGLNKEQAGKWVKKLRSEGRYQEDVWS